MKKVLSAVLAATMALSMAATSFAAGSTWLEPVKGKGEGQYYINLTDASKGDTFEIKDIILYNYNDKSASVYVMVKPNADLRADVDAGDIKVTDKRIKKNADVKDLDDFFGIPGTWDGYEGNYDVYEVKVTSDAPLRTFDELKWTVELDYEDQSYFVKGKNAYSSIREVEDGERYTNKESDKTDAIRNDDTGSIYEFNTALDSEVRINVNDYVDLFFKGNYGTDIENLIVSTDEINEVENYFDDVDVDYYDFLATPKFASDVKVRIDADPNAYIYEYNKATGELTDITDLCDYESDGFTFATKKLLTYVVAEEAYEGGNVNEEEEEDKDVVEEDKDTSKPNPGTGAF